uniref:Retinol dehydrogenase 3-like n=1 Tax=Saccoglossus kowalevskii TaxID=10224 RepID=A0ABM0MQ23_SACKO|nr:PREDICTED: retinol dehydrogenase 3-like [Saccoglossus kowalevskii]
MEVQTLVTVLLFSYIAFKLYDYLRRLQAIPGISARCVLVTGADSGFGYQLAQRLDKTGFFVIATCLTEKGAEDLKRGTSGCLRTVLMDVTNSESIKQCFEEVRSSIVQFISGLWGLVNNAGVMGTVGMYEWLSRAEYQQCLDVNIVGLIEVTTTFLPLIKKSRGRIVNVSSVLGRISLPGGPYSISKHAVESFSDGLRLTMRAYQVNVSIIEPGYFATNMLRADTLTQALEEKWGRQSHEVKESYGEEWFAKLKDSTMKLIETKSEKTHLVVDAMEHALTSIRPRCRYVVGYDAKLLWIPLSYLPAEITDFVLSLGMPKPKCCQDL